MRLSSLLADVDVIDVAGNADPEIAAVAFSHEAVTPGALFCCLPGRSRDGHDYAGEAASRGAAALVVERLVDVDLPQARVAESRRAMGRASAALHGHPSKRLDVVGVTGTNGKTTTAHLLAAIFDGAGRPCGVIGTMNNARTTPEAPDLQRLLAGFVDEGCTTAAVEVSSVGLAQHRTEGTSFAVGVFTNLSPDELWIHRTMEEYFAAKALLFDPDSTALGVVNADDEWGRLLIERCRNRLPVVPFRRDDAGDVRLSPGRSSFRWRGVDVEIPLEGDFNVMNGLAALTAAAELGISPSQAGEALAGMAPIAGHGDEVQAGQPFRVIVDFAHTSGALDAVLGSARRAIGSGGRVIVVFGCGGDRDPGRRAPMGEAAAANADLVIITSDNPRTEDPLAIIEEIRTGAAHVSGGRIEVEPDRRAAIEVALDHADTGDIVVIAGKGHERGQTIGATTLPFDDREVALEMLAARGFGGPS